MKHPGRATEVQVLELVRHRENYRSFNKIIEPDFFSNPATRRIFEEITRMYDKVNASSLKHGDLFSSIKVKEKDEDVVNEAKSVLVEMKRSAGKIQHDVVKDIAIDWSKRSLIRQALYEGLELLDRGNGLDLEPIRTRLDAAATLGVEEEQDYRYLAETKRRLDHESMVAPIEVGVPQIDEILQGGLDVGELGIFIGPTHRGKTRSLVNLGAHALRAGKHVAHIIIADSTSKRIARRYDSILCNRVYSVLRTDHSVLRRNLKEVVERGGKLTLKEYDKHSPTPNDIRHWVKSYTEKANRPLDLIIIDYLDEIKSERRYSEFRHESKEVTASIRRIGAEFNVPVWTASQGNRKSMEKRQVGLDDVAEDINRVNKADVVITLNQTDEEKEENVIRYRIVKARRENFTPKSIMLEISDAGVLTPVEGAYGV